MRRLAIPIGLALVLLTGTAEAQRCLHGPDESEAERARRRVAAVEFIQEVNADKKRLQRDRGTYVTLVDAVSMAGVPFGFVRVSRLTAWSYMVSLQDTLDPCGFGLFSDHHGVISMREGRTLIQPNFS